MKDAAPLLRHCVLSREHKYTLVHSLVFSKLLFAAEAWPALGKRAHTKMSAFVLKAYRLFLGMLNRKDQLHTTDLQVRAAFPLLDFDQLLSLKRLRYFQRLVNWAPSDSELQNLLLERVSTQGHSWYDLLLGDLQWGQSFSHALQTSLFPGHSLEAWIQFAHCH